ncbi:MAG TPA: mandelate racemase/muconate lactonizing enzyme family protein [Thermomicrobiales bacterium]|nr:mandelate racemase/muconate lactonizing enzyme family protein [Thermomicrobiales bacterium]
MKIEAVDFYYLSMPEILDIGDGSQDLLLVRLQAGPHVGWGECEAAPLPSIAALVCPMSHSACKPVRDSVLGQRLDDVADIDRIGDLVRANSMDLLQADHALSGIDIAMWDLLGRRLQAPVWQLLGFPRAEPRLPYASVLFGDTPAETLAKARGIRGKGYRAAKFGWGPYGRATVAADAAHVAAAREGLGPDGVLLVDAGTVWKHDVEATAARLPALRAAGATWLEEPFVSGALDAYRELSRRAGAVPLAGGEGSHNEDMARQMIDRAGIGYIQIDAGRIGGISPAKRVADYARANGVTYVNHTFTSHLALSASLQPYAGDAPDAICEYPVELKSLAWEITREHLLPDDDGRIRPPAAPGLGLTPDLAAARRYLLDVEIAVGGRTLYRTPALAD